MSFLNELQIEEIQDKLVSNEEELKKLFLSKKNLYQITTIENSKWKEYLEKGWEIEREFKNSTRIKKEKDHNSRFKDNLWCQFYELGFRIFNSDDNFTLPFGKELNDKKQIDIIALNNETIFLIDCKSNEKPTKAPSFIKELELLRFKIDGLKKSIYQLFGNQIKVKYIFATKNLRIDLEREEIKYFESANIFYYNDNTFEYVNNLIKHYKNASLFQFLGLIFKNESISNEKIEIPAVQGWMGKKKYYMFSIEPELLLKVGFILHRTKANDMEFPTYQRLLVPNRLKGITKFIDEGGYFPNSIIINFNDKKNKIQFQSSSPQSQTKARIGTLKIPNAYAIAYIIDGQHRLYGYANSDYRKKNTIPVVALTNLASEEQLSIFMDINENQKAVKPSLKLDLEEYLYWESDRTDSRLKALRSSIIKKLANDINGPLYNKISVGEDTALLSFKPFSSGLLKSGLLPNVKGNKYDSSSTESSLYDINNTEFIKEMELSRKKIVSLINKCYEFIEENYSHIYEKEKYFILSNRGTFALISIIGSLNKFLTEKEFINYSTNIDDRFNFIKKYLNALLEGINELSEEEEKYQLSLLGAGADIKWLRFFQLIINKKFNDYEPEELVDWKERQDEKLQDEGRSYGIEIEKYMKKETLSKLEKIYGSKWELEIGSIKRDCVDRALKEDERNHKEELDIEETNWKDMFNINDYKSIIEKHWTKKPNDDTSFVTFEKEFSIDMEIGFNSKSEKIKWISRFNSYRNLWAHEGSKGKRLNKNEVDFLKKIHAHFYISG
jgi:DNA sulfur modification protein DndB